MELLQPLYSAKFGISIQRRKMASSASSGVIPVLRRERGGGIPRKCRCRGEATIQTADTLKNPDRLFYCCPYGSKEDNTHLFKWTDVAIVEEVEEIETVVEKVRLDVGDMKTIVEGSEREINELKEVVYCCEKEIRELKTMVKWCKYIILVGIVVGMILYFTLA